MSTDQSRATSATLVPIGPTVSKLGQSGKTPSTAMRPNWGFSPTVPQAEEGRRIEPPVSLPSPMSHSPAASAAALPPEEPPAVRPGCAGFWTVPFLFNKRYMTDMGWEKLDQYTQVLFPGRIGDRFAHFANVIPRLTGHHVHHVAAKVTQGDMTYVIALAAIGAVTSIVFRRRFGMFKFRAGNKIARIRKSRNNLAVLASSPPE